MRDAEIINHKLFLCLENFTYSKQGEDHGINVISFIITSQISRNTNRTCSSEIASHSTGVASYTKHCSVPTMYVVIGT